MLFVAVGASAAELGSGKVITMTGATSYSVQYDDTVRFAYFTPNKDQNYCGTTYKSGQKYPIFLLDSTGTAGVEASILWEPLDGVDLSEFPYGRSLDVRGLAPTSRYTNALQACDRITMQWQGSSGGGKDVTVNIFHDSKSTGLFSFVTK